MSHRTNQTCLGLAVVCVFVSVGAWLSTGRETFTRWPNAKLESADVAAVEGEDELLASIGFDEPGSANEAPDVESRFAFGLVPSGLDPAHLLSVATGTLAGFGLVAFSFVSVRLCAGNARSAHTEPVS